MSQAKPIAIVGGGLAGLTLGIGLRQREIPVTVWEAGHYPRHRVCGEFISGNGPAVLERLGLLARFERAGAFRAWTAQFIAGPNRSPVRRLPEPALCLSRHVMDALLAAIFQELGGSLEQDRRWTSEELNEGIVRASGRRARPTERGWRWFGLKAHVARSSPPGLAADLEMHVSSGGYVGVNRINGGEVNVCGLFRARRGDPQPAAIPDRLRGEAGTFLRERLAEARFEPDSVCSVAGLSLKPQRAVDRQDCCIGDALTMTPPVTGNGMSMAFESAEIAVEPLAAYSRGKLSWAEARQRIALECDAAFSRRLAWARGLQWMMFSPALRGGLGAMVLRSERIWSLMFAKTR